MTRAKTEQQKQTPWFAKAGAACSIVPISRAVGPNAFALKGGGYAVLFSAQGTDPESLTDQELEAKVRGLEGALRGLPEGFTLYQYTRVLSGFDIPRQAAYADPVTENFVTDRLTFLNETAKFRRVDLHWCLAIEPPQGSPFSKKPKENAEDNSRRLAELLKAATILESHLGHSIGLQLLDKAKAFQFFSYLFNLEEWAERDQLRGDTCIDRQIVKSPVSWHTDHLRVGKRFVQTFSLKTPPEASRPCLFADLLKLDCDAVLCSTWRPKSTTAARKEIDQQEKFTSFFKIGVMSRVISARDSASLESTAGAKAANLVVDDLSDAIRSLDKKAQGLYSLTLLLAGKCAEQLRDVSPAVHRAFVDARAQVMEETLGNLSAFYAMFPGNHQFQVFSVWLAENHHARLSSIFAPHIGHLRSEDLDAEYLNVLETRSGTPFFQDPYVNGVKVGLTIGPTGSGKTTTLSAIREGAEASGYAVEGFAPTSKAAKQLREAGIPASTLQRFLARGSNCQTAADPASRHLYMLDESSLASTRQIRDFLDKISPQDRVLLIGDTRQHQGVDAGKPFEQMQDAGMRTAQLDRIMRQRDPELLAVVEKLSKNDTAAGVAMLQQQGRIQQIEGREERIAAIARDYAAKPENTIIVSPDNASRREINQTVRLELQSRAVVSMDNHYLNTLIPRSDLTGADRQWAARYNVGDVLHYNTGSKDLKLARGSYANVTAVDPNSNHITVRRQDGTEIAYDPKRLHGISAYQEIGRDFAKGDRIQFTAPSQELKVANRDLATIQRITDGRVTAKLDGKDQVVTFEADTMRHFDHGYAVTSHSSQGVTADRVLVNMDTRAHPELINTRFAYVSVSRASHDARIYTNDAAGLGERLSYDASKTSAVDFRQQTRKETTMNNDTQNTIRPEHSKRERVYTPAEHERHYAPLNRELSPQDAKQFGWTAENGTVQSYQHNATKRHIHIDGPTGQFYDQQKSSITKQAALERAIGARQLQTLAPTTDEQIVRTPLLPQDTQGFAL